ncbi:hypothetical protein [Paenibacillus polymyxa]|uniref:hypothetical protein n=1 Tax=Paenibacillus polymyxa TaxID=1406 RepID=UPI0004DF68E4|nr:hypothetical protein [Paenibacillus polymyxa]
MPVLNDVRMVGIHLDEGKKIIPDTLWQMHGLNVLQLLENGGGKTSLIQLITQTVLPNSSIAGRQLKKTLAKQTYGHIATEWYVEGDNPFYVCTGFSFMNAEKDEDDLKYFNYIYKYNDNSGLTIRSLPLQTNQSVTKYNELRSFLRKVEHPIVTIYDTQTEYKRALRNFHIIEEEWQAIRKINGDESGVSDYFAKAKKTEDLVKQVFIPTVESIIFRDEAAKKQIHSAYSTYKDNLLKIPETRQDISDFEVIASHAETVIKAVEAAKEKQEELETATTAMMRSYVSFKEKKEFLDTNIASLLTQEELMKQQILELEWKKESYPIHLEFLEINKLNVEIVKLKEDLSTIESQIEIERQKKSELEALQTYEAYLDNKSKWTKLSKDIELMGASHPELQKQIEYYFKATELSWNSLVSQEFEKVDEASNALVEVKREIDKLKIDKKENEQTKTTLERKHSELGAYISRYHSEKERLGALYGEAAVFTPDNTKASVEASIDALKKEIEDNDTQIKTCDNTLTDISTKEISTSVAFANIEHMITTQMQLIATYEEEKEKLNQLYLQSGVMTFDLFGDQEEHVLGLSVEIGQLEKEKEKLALEMAELKGQVDLLDKHDFYVPHEAMIDLKVQLKRDGAPVSLGSEWLSEQNMSEEEKQAYLDNFPLLPFSFVVDEGLMPTITRSLERRAGKKYEIPFLFQIKQSLIPGELYGTSMAVLKDGFYTFQNLDVKLFSSRAELETIKKSTKQQLENITSRYRTTKDNESHRREVLRSAKEFYAQYDVYSESKMNEELNRHNGILSEMGNELKELKKQAEDTTAQIIMYEDDIKDCQKEIEPLAKQQDALEQFIREFSDLKFVANDHHTIGQQIAEQDEILRKMESDQERLNEQATQRDRAHQERLREKSALERMGKELGLQRLRTENIDVSTMETFLSSKSNWLSVRDELENKNKSLNESILLRNNYKERMDEASSFIEKKSVSLSWCEVSQRSVQDDEISLVEQKIAKFEDTQSNKQISLDDLKSKKTWREGVMEGKTSAIAEKYKKPPFVFGQQHEFELEGYAFEHQTALAELKQTQEDMKTKREQSSDITKASDHFEGSDDFSSEAASSYSPMTPEEWDGIEKAYDWAKSKLTAFRKVKKAHEEEKVKTTETYNAYKAILLSTNNAKVKQFEKELGQSLVETGRLFDFEYVLSCFVQVFNALGQMKHNLALNLAELESDLQELVEQSYQRGNTLYESICEIPKHSKVELFNRTIQMVDMTWNRNDEVSARASLKLYINNLLEMIQLYKREGKTDEAIDQYMLSQLTSIQLLNQIAPIANCIVTIVKPRKKTMLQQEVTYHRWEEAASWSGGEGYTSYMVMFMILITHIRKKMHSKETMWKTIIADNPFGKASSEHVVRPIIELAQKNKIQLICLTAIRDEEIRTHFDVVISNRYYQVGGREVLQTNPEKMNIGHLSYATK